MEYGVCECGAVTVYIDGENYSMPKEKFEELFASEPTERINGADWYSCNYCVNKWGIDLCGCGSGEKVGECDGDFTECRNKIPMQSIELAKTKPTGGWI